MGWDQAGLWSSSSQSSCWSMTESSSQGQIHLLLLLFCIYFKCYLMTSFFFTGEKISSCESIAHWWEVQHDCSFPTLFASAWLLLACLFVCLILSALMESSLPQAVSLFLSGILCSLSLLLRRGSKRVVAVDLGCPSGQNHQKMQKVRESFHTACMLWDGAFGFEYVFDSSNSSSRRLYLPKGVKMIQKWELYEQGGMRKNVSACFSDSNAVHTALMNYLLYDQCLHIGLFLKRSLNGLSLLFPFISFSKTFYSVFEEDLGSVSLTHPFFLVAFPSFFLAVCLHLWFTSSADLL